eukprot:TRINITY_DN6536_c0_g3_i1.p1 TRINITY_DN6536_c0_g3~~TRINITY_DN6536_c0_g3_i1.p1  ORF type:complete len:495 (-),score=105.32 TRINITY_DN6536_c0_g3_i1:143-1627(-)
MHSDGESVGRDRSGVPSGFEFGDELGRHASPCGFGEVWKAEWQGTSVTIKRYLHAEFAHHGPSHRDRFVRQLQLLQAAPHPHLARIYGLSQSPSDMYVVTEYAERGTIRAALDQRRRGFPLDVAVVYIQQIVSALVRLHSSTPRLVHHNIKSTNLLLTPTGVKLADPVGADPYRVGLDIAAQVVSGLVTNMPYLPPEMLALFPITSNTTSTISPSSPSTATATATTTSTTNTTLTPGSALSNAIAIANAHANTRIGNTTILSRDGSSPNFTPSSPNNPDIDESVDVYAIGILWWELLTGDHPFGSLEGEELCAAVCAGQRPPIPDPLPINLIQCLRVCWRPEPHLRPRLRALLDALLWIHAVWKDPSPKPQSQLASPPHSGSQQTPGNRPTGVARARTLTDIIPSVLSLEPYTAPEGIACLLRSRGILPDDVRPFAQLRVTLEEFKECGPQDWEAEPFCLKRPVIDHLLRIQTSIINEGVVRADFDDSALDMPT